MTTQLVKKREREKLRETFTALDKNADGKLSREELMNGYSELYGNNINKAKQEVDKIMDNVDVDRSGFIDYSGIISFFS